MELNKTNHSTTLNTITNTIILDGRKSSKEIYQELGSGIRYLLEKNIIPFLAVILVGERPDSMTYVKMKKRRCEKYGIGCKIYKYPVEVENEELIELIQELNLDGRINGILVQLPLPEHLNTDLILDNVVVEKDVDGFHTNNFGKMSLNSGPTFMPCTPRGCMELFDRYNIEIEGKDAVIIGNSRVIGLPISLALMYRDATVTICHIKTQNLKEKVQRADILVSACGCPEMVKGDWLKEGCVVIDVGISKVDDPTAKRGYRIVGDVEQSSARKVAKAITPVPGGVGPMTIAMLIKHTMEAAYIQNNLTLNS